MASLVHSVSQLWTIETLLEVSTEILGVELSVVLVLVIADSVAGADDSVTLFFGPLSQPVVIAIMLIAHKMKFGENKDGVYTLKYQVGEDLANTEVFEEAISKHCSTYNLQSVRTIEYGQLYEVRYNVTLKKDASVKALIDEVRMHNANLNVSVIIAEKD